MKEEKVSPHARTMGNGVTNIQQRYQNACEVYEFHIDTSEEFIPFVKKQECGANLSCRMQGSDTVVNILG